MQPVTQRRWVCRGEEAKFDEIESFVNVFGISDLTARVLCLRGIESVESGREFLDSRLASLPDPFLMQGMDKAVERLVLAIENGEKISVHGDFDVDGISGTALLVETLRSFGAIVEYHIPLRLRDGYGLSVPALEQAAASNAKVVLSVDCGVSAVDEAKVASSLGLDLIVTDHHQPPETLPEALAIINPCLPGCNFPFKFLAGVGVAFFLMAGLRKKLRDRGFFSSIQEPDLRRCLDLVALGTIADIVPLKGINRILAKTGISVLNNGSRMGVKALRDVTGANEISCGIVAFCLAPRLNAAGRMEDASLGVELLLEPSYDRARQIAGMLEDFNRARQKIEQEALNQAIERLEEETVEARRSIVLADSRWHPGVIGIVASRLVERYYRPTVLISLEGGLGKGSARSVKGFHLYRTLAKCKEYLCGFGGHELAAGLSIEEDLISSFASTFEDIARKTLDEEDLTPEIPYDGEIMLEEISMDAVKELAMLAPFGAGNPEPLFVAPAIRAQQIQKVGEKHLRFIARQGGYSHPCIAFGMAARMDELKGEVDLMFIPTVNEWRGNVSVQLRVKDFRPAKPI